MIKFLMISIMVVWFILTLSAKKTVCPELTNEDILKQTPRTLMLDLRCGIEMRNQK